MGVVNTITTDSESARPHNVNQDTFLTELNHLTTALKGRNFGNEVLELLSNIDTTKFEDPSTALSTVNSVISTSIESNMPPEPEVACRRQLVIDYVRNTETGSAAGEKLNEETLSLAIELMRLVDEL